MWELERSNSSLYIIEHVKAHVVQPVHFFGVITILVTISPSFQDIKKQVRIETLLELQLSSF